MSVKYSFSCCEHITGGVNVASYIYMVNVSLLVHECALCVCVCVFVYDIKSVPAKKHIMYQTANS